MYLKGALHYNRHLAPIKEIQIQFTVVLDFYHLTWVRIFNRQMLKDHKPSPSIKMISIQYFNMINIKKSKFDVFSIEYNFFINMSYLEADSTCHLQFDENHFLQDKSEAGALVLANDLKQLGQPPGLLG